MRILVLIHEYPPVGGGGGRVAQDICTGLVKAGHTVKILSAHCGDLPRQETVDGLQIIRLRSWRRQMFRADLRAMVGYILAAVWRGLAEVRQFRPDVIHAHFAVPAGAAAWLISKLTGVPYVLTAHLGDVPGGTPEKTGKWFKLIFPFTPPIWNGAAAVTAVSEFTRGLAQNSYAVPVQVIPNGVDLHENDPGPLEVHHPPQVVFAGRFMAQKNPLQVVRALAAVRDLPWRCVMAGDGPLMDLVLAEIEKYDLHDRFTLPGWVTPQDVLQVYRQSDILLLPSYSEGLPVVGVQAMAYGLALVLSRAGGNPELITGTENGALIDHPDDGAAYAAALRRLLGSPDALLAARQRSRELAARFDLPEIVRQYEQVLSAALRQL